MTGPEPVVNYVIEARRGDRPWIIMSNTGDNEELGRAAYDDWLAAKQHAGSSTLRYRLVRRTAVITDEIVEQEEQ
jgi:hypothetical protein